MRTNKAVGHVLPQMESVGGPGGKGSLASTNLRLITASKTTTASRARESSGLSRRMSRIMLARCDEVVVQSKVRSGEALYGGYSVSESKIRNKSAECSGHQTSTYAAPRNG